MVVQPYREWQIEFNERAERWEATKAFDDEEVERLTNASLTKLKESIDRRLSPKRVSLRVPAFWVESEWNGAWASGEVTSASRSNDARFTPTYGKSTHTVQSRLFAPTDENRELLTKRAELIEEADRLRKQAGGLYKKLTAADLSALKDNE